jgi:hypothetical protein
MQWLEPGSAPTSTNHVVKPPLFGRKNMNIRKNMCLYFKAMSRKNMLWRAPSFIMLDMKYPTPREQESLQLNDQALNIIYKALDLEVFVLQGKQSVWLVETYLMIMFWTQLPHGLASSEMIRP